MIVTVSLAAAIESLKHAVAADPNLLEARFNLALACAKAGRRADAHGHAPTSINKVAIAQIPSPRPRKPR